ncbi:hypothetical protein J4479_03290 [Candidatus Woesearchaeota archaeon]|nr:hypothetical protein [Candidatus Woesearchaeota archaeon]
MATVQDFKDAEKIAKNAEETQKRRLRMAVDQALGTIVEGQYIDPGMLNDEHRRRTFTETINNELAAPYTAAIAGMPDDPRIARGELLNGAYGFQPAFVTGLVDQAKDNFSYEGFMATVDKNTGWKQALEAKSGFLGEVLDSVSAAEIGNYASIAILDASKLGLQDKAQLIGLTDAKKSLDEKLAEIGSKPYMKAPTRP